METGYLIFAKHPVTGGTTYPARVDRVTKKTVWFTDDDGRICKVAKTNCVTQNQWHVSNTFGIKKADISPLGQPRDGYKTHINQRGMLTEFVGIKWIEVGEAKSEDYYEYPVIC